MDQICLVVPFFPAGLRTPEASCRNRKPAPSARSSEPESSRRPGTSPPTPAETCWRLEPSGRVRLLASHGRGRAHAPDHVICEGQVMFPDCPAYLDEDGARRCGLPA